MRIAVVEPIGRGGMIHYAFQLARGLDRAGAEVTLVTDRHYELEGLETPFEVVRLFRLWDPKPAEGDASRLPGLRSLRRAARAARWHREWARLVGWASRRRPDVVQLGDLRFGADAFWLGRLDAAGLVLADVCHNVRPFALGGAAAGSFRRSRIGRLLYDRAYRRFARVFVHYESNRRTFLESFDVPPERVVTIPHGNERIFDELRDPSATPDRLRAELELAAGGRVVLLFGTLARYKGVDVLLRAFSRVSREVPDATLVVAGYPIAGFDAGAARDLADALGIAGRTRIVPRWIPSGEVAAWMELADLAVFPYRSGWQSGAVATAATFGLPIVATDVGAMPDALLHGRTGLLVPPGDAPALGRAIVRLLHDPDLAGELGRRARTDAENRGDWETIASRLVEGYREIVR